MGKKPDAGEEEVERERAAGETPAGGGTAPGETASGTIHSLEERCAALETERGQLEDRWKRTLAEADNARRRFSREREEFELRAAQRYLVPFLEVADGLERALRSAAAREAMDAPEGAGGPFSAFVRGVELTRDTLHAALAREGVSPIECVGRPFDPQLHEAVMQVENEELDSHTVVEEFQRGYMMKDRLLRPAKVSVAR